MQSTFKKREIRVSTCGKRTKRAEQSKKLAIASAVDITLASDGNNQGSESNDKLLPAQKVSDQIKKPAFGAARRLQVC